MREENGHAMERGPKIGVVIATYNYGHLIEECLDSVFEQTYLPHVIMVVDDGSIDNTQEILSGIKDPLLTVRTLNVNSGVSHARNVGIRELMDYVDAILFHDADDIMVENKIKIMVERLFSNPMIGGVYADFIEYYLDIDVMVDRFREPYNWVNMPLRCLVNNNSMVKTEVLKRMQSLGWGFYDESLQTSEDYDFWWKVSKISYLVHIPKPLTIIRKHGGNTDYNLSRDFVFKNAAIVQKRIAEDMISHASAHKQS